MILNSARLVLLGLVGVAASTYASDELPITGIPLKDSSGKVTAAFFFDPDGSRTEIMEPTLQPAPK